MWVNVAAEKCHYADWLTLNSNVCKPARQQYYPPLVHFLCHSCLTIWNLFLSPQIYYTIPFLFLIDNLQFLWDSWSNLKKTYISFHNYIYPPICTCTHIFCLITLSKLCCYIRLLLSLLSSVSNPSSLIFSFESASVVCCFCQFSFTMICQSVCLSLIVCWELYLRNYLWK